MIRLKIWLISLAQGFRVIRSDDDDIGDTIIALFEKKKKLFLFLCLGIDVCMVWPCGSSSILLFMIRKKNLDSSYLNYFANLLSELLMSNYINSLIASLRLVLNIAEVNKCYQVNRCISFSLGIFSNGKKLNVLELGPRCRDSLPPLCWMYRENIFKKCFFFVTLSIYYIFVAVLLTKWHYSTQMNAKIKLHTL